MPNYSLTFRLEPWPSTAEEELETSIDSSEQTALHQQFALEEAQAETKNDRLIISLAAADDRAAVERGINLANRFCMFLSLYQAQYFRAVLVTAINQSEGRVARVGGGLSFESIRVYAFTKLGKDMGLAAARLSLKDTLIEKAVAYFYHAQFLTDGVKEMIFGYASEDAPNPGRAAAFHEALLVSGAILHYFKCAATIMGEPREEDFQSRYRSFGIPEELKRDTEELWRIRSGWDIAHYEPGWERVERLESHHYFAMTTAEKVLHAYMNWRIKNP